MKDWTISTFRNIARAMKGNFYFPSYSKWVFLAVLLIMSAIYDYHGILIKPTQSLHQWRQCDCLSITLNYAAGDQPIHKPVMHNLGGDGTGMTAAEFPIVYYLVGNLWKITGQQEFLYRALVVLLFFTALFALFRLLETELHDSVLALFGSLLLFTSPTLVYYGNNFLMDIPALSFAMLGLYFFFRFHREKKERLLILSMAFYAIGGLLKISSLLSFFAILGVFLAEVSGLTYVGNARIFTKPLKQAVMFVVVILLQGVWYTYARHYNTVHNEGNFLIGILPIWAMDAEQIRLTLDAIGEHIKWDYFRRETLVFFILLLPFLLLFYKRNERVLNLLIVFLLTGFTSFVLLFFNALKDHDYYVINLFIIFPVILLGIFILLRNRFPRIYGSLLLRILLLAFLIHNIDFASRRISGRYSVEGWANITYDQELKHYATIGPFLDSIGVGKQEMVISLSDESINITLYLMDRKGWTNYNIENDSTRMAEKIGQGAGFLFTHGDFKPAPGLASFFNNPVGEYWGIRVYGVGGR